MMADLSRYNRQLVLSEIGVAGQEKLRAASVLVVGAGGLGCPTLQYLAGAGIGTIGIMDFDSVEISNLHRQPLFRESDIGKNKALCAADRLSELNSDITIFPIEAKLTQSNIRSIISSYDIIIDGTDSLAARYLINDACILSGKPFIFGALHRYSGQASVFNYTGNDGHKGPGYRDVFPVPPEGAMATCESAGVMGPLAGIIGSIQATEAIKIITGFGEVSSGFMLQLDVSGWNFIKWQLPANDPKNNITPVSWEELEAFDYEKFVNGPLLKEGLFPEDWDRLIAGNEPFQLLDVRETWEAESDPVPGAMNIPVSLIEQELSSINPLNKILVICASGQRSRIASTLLREHGFQRVFHLEGGLKKWKEHILKPTY